MSLERGRYYAILGALVVRERKRKKLTQTALGKLVGASQSSVARLEAAKFSVPVTFFARLADALFGVTHATLDKRISNFSETVARVERSVVPARIPSRDTDRKLIDYIVAVSG